MHHDNLAGIALAYDGIVQTPFMVVMDALLAFVKRTKWSRVRHWLRLKMN
ncbi:MAG: hypothetical protein L0Y71_08440 [Gemmataceae bacterium]|nr:hypothetical protein [Gemmataceae bacterium]